MMDSEEKIIQALKSVEAELHPREVVENYQQIVTDMFRYSSFTTEIFMTYIPSLAITGLAIFSAVRFFNATDIPDLMHYAVLLMLSVSGIVLYKVWFGLRWVRNSIMREIKRMELRLVIAGLPEQTKHILQGLDNAEIGKEPK